MFPFQQNPIPFNPFTPQNSLSSLSLIPTVNGFEGAKAYQVQLNSKVALFDTNEDIFYIKSVDANGAITIRKFSFVEVLDETPEQAQYVTVKEFEKFKEEILNGQQHIYRNSKPKHNSSNKSYGSARNNDPTTERYAESSDVHTIDADE